MWESVRSWISGERAGKRIGFLFGILLGVLYLVVGFWEMLVFTVIVTIAYGIGNLIDRGHWPYIWRSVWDYLTQRWRG